MDREPWADAELSDALERLAQRGEGQDLEFKADLPKHVSALADEVAAFSTSNDGTILLGVADDGRIVGLEGMRDPQARDRFASRIVGALAQIKPDARTSLLWATWGEQVVLAIKVRKGVQPLYYAGGRPMVRKHASSRPATPEEVIEAVRAYIAAGSPEMDAEQRAQSEFVAGTASLIAELLGWCDTPARMLDMNPWCDHWHAAAESGASSLRDSAAERIAADLGHAEHLEATARTLDAVAEFRHVLSGGNSFAEVTATARTSLASSFSRIVGSAPLDRGSVQGLAEAVEKACRKLAEAWSRAAGEPFGGQLERTLDEASYTGRHLLKFSYFDLGGRAASARLHAACLHLVSLEERRIFSDGGSSETAVIADGRTGVELLRAAALALREAVGR